MIRHQRKVFPEWEKRRIACQQSYRCAICQQLLPFAWELDHIQPLFKGGDNRRNNVQILCSCCHAEKSIIERAAPSALTTDGDVDLSWATCPERVARARPGTAVPRLSPDYFPVLSS